MSRVQKFLLLMCAVPLVIGCGFVTPFSIGLGFVISLFSLALCSTAYVAGRSDREEYFSGELEEIAAEILPPVDPNYVPVFKLSESTRKIIRPYALLAAIRMQLFINKTRNVK